MHAPSKDSNHEIRERTKRKPCGSAEGIIQLSRTLARQMLATQAEEIIAATIEAAKAGDVGAMRLCWDRFAPCPEMRPTCRGSPSISISSVS